VFGTNILTYDFNGNLQTVTDAGGTATYNWNARSQLAGISSTGFAASFSYDSFGRRTGKTIQGTTTNYVYDGLNPVQEKAGATVTANLLAGLGIDEFLTRTDGAGTRGLLTDALGSTVALGDGTGTIQTQYTYEPFGYASQTGQANTNSYKYTGREDDGSGLYYYRARSYHPRLQRFIAEDPIGFRGEDMNLYAFVQNNPNKWIDPIGFMSWQDAQRQEIPFDQWWNDPDTTMQDQIDAEAIDPNPGIDPIDIIAGGNACRRLYEAGGEFRVGKNWRFAPFGNRTGHPLGEWPHYHRRGMPGPDGKTPPGQGIGRHRPLEKSDCDKNFCDRF
jgi:RHS repeat-associated protein